METAAGHFSPFYQDNCEKNITVRVSIKSGAESIKSGALSHLPPPGYATVVYSVHYWLYHDELFPIDVHDYMKGLFVRDMACAIWRYGMKFFCAWLRCYDTLEQDLKFLTDFSETFQNWSTTNPDVKKQKKIGCHLARFFKIHILRYSTFCIEN